MAVRFSADGVVASGALLEVMAPVNLHGAGPARLLIVNAGAAALTACKVRVGADADHMSDEDVVTFASLAPGASSAIHIVEPIELMDVLASCATVTALDIRLLTREVWPG